MWLGLGIEAADFDDAERDPAPKMLKPVAWDAVKKFFRTEIQKV